MVSVLRQYRMWIGQTYWTGKETRKRREGAHRGGRIGRELQRLWWATSWLSKSAGGIKAVRIVEMLLIFTMAEFYFSIMAWCIWTNQHMVNSQGFDLKQGFIFQSELLCVQNE